MSSQQSANQIIMIEPRAFCSNPETASTNAHQLEDDTPGSELQEKALEEHRRLVKVLLSNHIDIKLIPGLLQTPDDLFCNNWISFHENEPFVLYPLMAHNRRLERREDLCREFEKEKGKPIDFSYYEQQGCYLESTGSMVLDRKNRKAYACASPRTDKAVFLKWCERLGYEPFFFTWHYPNGDPVYHTNVIMFIGTSVAGICSEGVDPIRRTSLISSLAANHEIVDLTFEQVNLFCGNSLELRSYQGEVCLVMSTSAYDGFRQDQLAILEKHYDAIIHSDIPTIETYGGGSVRCLILEKF